MQGRWTLKGCIFLHHSTHKLHENWAQMLIQWALCGSVWSSPGDPIYFWIHLASLWGFQESSALPRIHAHAGERVPQVWGVIPVWLPREEHWRFAVATAVGMCVSACVHVHGCVCVHVSAYKYACVCTYVCACVNTKGLMTLSLIVLLYIVSEEWILMTMIVKELVRN